MPEALSALNEMLIWFVFESDYVVCYIYLRTYVEPSLCFWDEVYLILLYDLFDVFSSLGLKYFIENFCGYVHGGEFTIWFENPLQL